MPRSRGLLPLADGEHPGHVVREALEVGRERRERGVRQAEQVRSVG